VGGAVGAPPRPRLAVPTPGSWPPARPCRSSFPSPLR